MPTSVLRSWRSRCSAPISSGRRWADDSHDFTVRAERSSRLPGYRQSDRARALAPSFAADPLARGTFVRDGHLPTGRAEPEGMRERSPPGGGGNHRIQDQRIAVHDAVLKSATADPQGVIVDDAVGVLVDPVEVLIQRAERASSLRKCE